MTSTTNSRRNLTSIGTQLSGDVVHGQYGHTTILSQLSSSTEFLSRISYQFREHVEYRFDITRTAELLIFEVKRMVDGEGSSFELNKVATLKLTSPVGQIIVRELRAKLDGLFLGLQKISEDMLTNQATQRAMAQNFTISDNAPIQHLQFLCGAYLLTGGSQFLKEVTAIYVLGRFELRIIFQAFDVAGVLGTDKPTLRQLVQQGDTSTGNRLGQKNSYQLTSWKRGPVKISTYGTYRVRTELIEDDENVFTPQDILAHDHVDIQHVKPLQKREAVASIPPPIHSNQLSDPVDRILECAEKLKIAGRASSYKPDLADITDGSPVADIASEVHRGGMLAVFASAEALGGVVPLAYRMKFKTIAVAVQTTRVIAGGTLEDITNILITMSLILTQADVTRIDEIPNLKDAEAMLPNFAEIHAAWVAGLK